MFSQQRRSRRQQLVTLAGALLLVLGAAELRAQDMGASSGKVTEVPSGLATDPDAVLVGVQRKGAMLEVLTGKGNAAESGRYSPPVDAVKFEGACRDEEECKQALAGKAYVEITGAVSTKALGVTPDDPITEVIPALIVKVGNGSCWWSCSGSGGSQSCQCVCVGGGSCPRH